MFTVVERYALQSSDWLVLDDHGEERFVSSFRQSSLRFACRLTTEAEDYERDLARRRQDALQAEAHNFVRAGHRRGASQAYSHCAMRLSFLLGGTLPPVEMLAQARLLVQSMDQWGDESLQKADEIEAQIEARVAAVR
jgi:hypothetical protein